MAEYLATPEGRQIAYHRVPGKVPGVVFLGGFRSDMTGTKAANLAEWASAQNRAFVRFDYSGHGQSSGLFEDGTIGDWLQDARAVLEMLTEGPQVLVGSSMGGWIACLLAREVPGRVAGLVGIAAAPDFTEDSMWAGLSPAQQASLLADGRIALSSEFSDTPYVITRRLIEEARSHLVLRSPLPMPFPVRLLHGEADADVPTQVCLQLFGHISGNDVQMILVKDAYHRFSSVACLTSIKAAIRDVLAESSG